MADKSAIVAALTAAERHGSGGNGAVLLHAAGSSPRALRALAATIAGAAGRTIAPPLPMAVSTAGIAHPLATQIAVAHAALADGTASPRVLFGHSFGGLVAVLALLDGATPDAVVLYEPIVLACLNDTDAGDAAARAWDRVLIDRLAACTAAGDPEPGIAGFIEAYNEVTWTALPDAPRQALIADAASLVALTQTVHHLSLDQAKLHTLDVPVLVLSGAQSPDVAQLMAMRLAALLPRAHHVSIKGAGHMGPVRAPAAVGAAISAFLARAL